MVTLGCKFIGISQYSRSNWCVDFHRYTFALQEDFIPIDVLLTWSYSKDDSTVRMSIQNKLVHELKEYVSILAMFYISPLLNSETVEFFLKID